VGTDPAALTSSISLPAALATSTVAYGKIEMAVRAGDLIFASPVASVSPTLSVSLSTGGSGSATFDGYAVYVPEANGLVMLCAGALALWALSRRRST